MVKSPKRFNHDSLGQRVSLKHSNRSSLAVATHIHAERQHTALVVRHMLALRFDADFFTCWLCIPHKELIVTSDSTVVLRLWGFKHTHTWIRTHICPEVS